jgi:transcriptional regulator with AAA-type ATPase domain
LVTGAIEALTECNPFLPERMEWERRALGTSFVDAGAVWHAEADLETVHPNVSRVGEIVESLAPVLRERLAGGARATDLELRHYGAVARYWLFQRYDLEWWALIEKGMRGEPATSRVASYRSFARDADHFFSVPGVRFPEAMDAAHLFAWAFQIRRAFHHTFRHIFGGSMPSAHLRAAVWQSIFTRDGRRYGRVLFDRMNDITTLITGESGTGKELVARAIGLSRYIPFDAAKQCFVDDYATAVQAVNLSALSPTLIESEMFGHRRGAFTGAVEDRPGWLETCRPLGAVFLDEIGELDAAIQVKLLRVLQSRTFQRIGESKERVFTGKIIAATNRDLAEEMEAGRLRPDFYYRLCADVIRTPALREQFADSPQDLHTLTLILARRIAGDEEAEILADEVVTWIRERLGEDYPWPGNVRELEQCVRNILIRGNYEPLPQRAETADPLVDGIRRCSLNADQLLRYYCERVYAETGSYQETARRLGLDRRTVRGKLAQNTEYRR